jgi:hypothetical protein
MAPFVTLLEIHKLMYFMQEDGEPLITDLGRDARKRHWRRRCGGEGLRVERTQEALLAASDRHRL